MVPRGPIEGRSGTIERRYTDGGSNIGVLAENLRLESLIGQNPAHIPGPGRNMVGYGRMEGQGYASGKYKEEGGRLFKKTSAPGQNGKTAGGKYPPGEKSTALKNGGFALQGSGSSMAADNDMNIRMGLQAYV